MATLSTQSPVSSIATQPKVALITGQDGSDLAEFLLDKGCLVYGIKRPDSSFSTQRIDYIYQART